MKKIKKYLHIKYKWFKCRFHPFDICKLKASGDEIICRWCGKKYKTNGYPYLDCKLSPINITNK